jgi:hypothetical protein
LNTKIKILECRCSDYEKQLAEATRNNAAGNQAAHQRYNVEEAVTKINELSQHCQMLIIEGRNKDKKI